MDEICGLKSHLSDVDLRPEIVWTFFHAHTMSFLFSCISVLNVIPDLVKNKHNFISSMTKKRNETPKKDFNHCTKPRTTYVQWSLFSLKSQTFGLGQTNWQINSVAFGVFLAELSAPIFWYSKFRIHAFFYFY